ncbi:unnamed protein product [Schistosoma rodhaini]|uniref:Cytochrome c oxidase assembly protein COX16 homolog, mitochondrial n=2 Tax=Schistosoma TaxID=6181 RepID=G4VTM3_SCHMA|nr:hypothetical protein Smp_077390 [Schistosoma mansoni]CAH8680749.1 unnamed protein product [Schistosoma rodhaini]CAH8682502.1 unnamed protein product [Schistosoma rodhaini]|eukprot:XP_018655665.1 hypothetical protein Smp_077390 [Schistosoma mansoni]
MKGGFQPLLNISRSYDPIVIRNPNKMSRIRRLGFLALFMLPMVGALGIATTFKHHSKEYKGPEIVK